jgi:hypothetical protein
VRHRPRPQRSGARVSAGTLDWPAAALAEREGEQAGAQQHEAGCGQREESVGHKVMFTHDAPVTLDARPNSLKVSESVFLKRACGFRRGSGPRAKALECVSKKNADANQAEKRCNRLKHRKFPLRPGWDKTTAALHSQKEFLVRIDIRI